MFFLGIFGTNAKVEAAGYLCGCRCPACGKKVNLHLSKRYHYLHAFFLPVLKYDKQYLATCPNCASIMAVDESAVKRCENSSGDPVQPEELSVIRSNFHPVCPGCGMQVSTEDRYCRQCGKEL